MVHKDNVPEVFKERLCGFIKTKPRGETERLAKFLGKKRQTVNTYVLGKCLPTLSGLHGIAVFYNTSADYLIGLSDDLRSNKTTRVRVVRKRVKHKKEPTRNGGSEVG